MRTTLLLCFLLTAAASVQGQNYGPRVFLDIPNIFLTAPDLENINSNMGAGLETALNVGTHWGVARIGGGATLTANPKADDFEASLVTTPYALLEAGAGMYRSNGNQCAKSHQSAFTALVKAGIRYDFNTRDLTAAEDDIYGIDFTVGVELGYFFIRDIFKNYEVFVRSNYYTQDKTASADFGFKLFLNLRADRD